MLVGSIDTRFMLVIFDHISKISKRKKAITYSFEA